jgi:transmembrane 9 superfamily protein 2/4
MSRRFAGFDLGEATETSTTFNNHYDILIEYHQKDADHARVVGVLVWPASRDNLEAGLSGDACSLSSGPLQLRTDRENEFFYTYSVQFRVCSNSRLFGRRLTARQESKVAWATRWDSYLPIYASRIHYLSLFNSVVLCLFLSGMVGVVLLRTVNKDISHFNAIDLSEDTVQEDTGWKLLHAEVFRPPRHRMYLAVIIGAGAQLVGVVLVSLLFAILGFLSPSNRGSLGTIM